MDQYISQYQQMLFWLFQIASNWEFIISYHYICFNSYSASQEFNRNILLCFVDFVNDLVPSGKTPWPQQIDGLVQERRNSSA